MDEMTIFQNPEFGQVRTITRDGEPWFVGVDVCNALGYSNSRIHRHGIGTEEEMLVTMEGGDPVHTHDIPPSFTGYTNLAHRHGISGRKKMRVHLGLTLGEHVVLLRLQGGQQYLVWDRVV